MPAHECTGIATTGLKQCVSFCRIPGHLKVCSNALYFVPRAVQEPIYRIPYRHILQIDRSALSLAFVRTAYQALILMIARGLELYLSGHKGPYRWQLCACRVCDEEGYASEDTFYVTGEERVSLKMYNKNMPYVTSGVCPSCTVLGADSRPCLRFTLLCL